KFLSFVTPQTARQWTWRLNPTLLHNPESKLNTHKGIIDYFTTNDTQETTRGTLWVAHKAVLRGSLIAEASRLKKQKLSELETHLHVLRNLESQHKQNPTETLLEQIKTHQQTIKAYIAKDSQKALQWSKQLFYDKSNKADTLLVRKLQH
ncbi:Hypothetical predicted protein, partial [Pelobates cultripes]